MTVQAIRSVEELDGALSKAGEAVVVLDFGADWSEGSKQMSSVLAELATECEGPRLSFFRVDAEGVPELSLKYSIRAVPTIVFLAPSSHEPFDRIDGVHVAVLTKKCRALRDGEAVLPVAKASPSASSSTSQPQPPPSHPPLDLNARIKAIIASHKAMLFMKGSPEAPQCGFSRQIVAILDEMSADYGHFDILSDNAVREGLKKLSNWPTYPQLYVDGELIGGLDIVKELKAAGELDLPQKIPIENRLKELIKRAKVMVFMKGDPAAPRCKFSKALMEIMKEDGTPFQSFDILQDDDVREGLKKYSNWPTYPQVYVDGDLIGGIDIIKELKETGELSSTLQGN